MLRENTFLETLLRFGRKVIPKPIFQLFQPLYHWCLAWFGALIYGFPGRSLKIIGVTGTKGKSSVVYIASKIFEEAGISVAAIGSICFKIKDREWPNELKMTMPGRFKLQKFLKSAKNTECTHVILEVTSEGIKQKRHAGIRFDAAAFTNLAPEHIESHGSFEKYREAKLKLFKAVKSGGTIIVNADDENADYFLDFPVKNKIGFGLNKIQNYITPDNYTIDEKGITFTLNGVEFHSALLGEFNLYNILAALSIARAYNINLETAKRAIEKIKILAGRMQEIENNRDLKIFVDYAHTPDSLKATYKILQPMAHKKRGKLICLFGATGGGRDKWKRPKMGEIAAEYCDEIILTTDDPYDEKPSEIIDEIETGILLATNSGLRPILYYKIPDRKEAIKKALSIARQKDVIILSGKGSETSMVVAGGKKIPWSDAYEVEKVLSKNL